VSRNRCESRVSGLAALLEIRVAEALAKDARK